MLRPGHVVVAVAALAVSLWLPVASRAQGSTIQDPTPATAALDATAGPARMAAGQAVVAYENGELRIEARNARVIDVLRTACDKIGVRRRAGGQHIRAPRLAVLDGAILRGRIDTRQPAPADERQGFSIVV